MRVLLLAAAAVMSCTLGGCANTSGAVNLLNTLEQNYAHCHHTVTYNATVGAMNPGSGAMVQGTIDCPAIPPAAAADIPATTTAPTAQ
jgi:outer membrane lipoprotein SlyB